MIESFGDKETEGLYNGLYSARAKRFPKDILSAALRRMDMLNAAHDLDDLRVPPGNRLEALRGDMKGFHSIRVNDRWRIIFRWSAGAHDVSLVDYH
ncbi:MAG: type II toxin-antitoxin system RelE/ParE family toxin [bacterium]